MERLGVYLVLVFFAAQFVAFFSWTNLPLIIAFMQRYRPDAGIGPLVATMLPYSVTFLLGWTLLLVIWILFELPVGPGAPLYLDQRVAM